LDEGFKLPKIERKIYIGGSIMSEIDFKKLQDKFSPEDITWKPQISRYSSNGKPYCMMVPFLKRKPLLDRLDEICGPENWKYSSREVKDGFLGAIAIRIKDEWVEKWDGAQASGTDAIKTGLTDAFKRSAVHWNVCNCRALYSIGEMFATQAQQNDVNNQGFKAISVTCKKDKNDRGQRFFFLPPLLPANLFKDKKPKNTSGKTPGNSPVKTQEESNSKPSSKPSVSLNEKIKQEYSRLLQLVNLTDSKKKNQYIAETRDAMMMKIQSDKKSVDHLKNDEKQQYLDTLITHVNSIEEAKSLKKTG
jgi:hypothetical protein